MVVGIANAGMGNARLRVASWRGRTFATSGRDLLIWRHRTGDALHLGYRCKLVMYNVFDFDFDFISLVKVQRTEYRAKRHNGIMIYNRNPMAG